MRLIPKPASPIRIIHRLHDHASSRSFWQRLARRYPAVVLMTSWDVDMSDGAVRPTRYPETV